MSRLPEVDPLNIASMLQCVVFHLHPLINTGHGLTGREVGFEVLNGPEASMIGMTLKGKRVVGFFAVICCV